MTKKFLYNVECRTGGDIDASLFLMLEYKNVEQYPHDCLQGIEKTFCTMLFLWRMLNETEVNCFSNMILICNYTCAKLLKEIVSSLLLSLH